MLSPEAVDIIVDGISGEICKENPTEECPIAVDSVIRAALPLLAAAGADSDFAQVFCQFGGEINNSKPSILNLLLTGIYIEHFLFQFHRRTPSVTEL